MAASLGGTASRDAIILRNRLVLNGEILAIDLDTANADPSVWRVGSSDTCSGSSRSENGKGPEEEYSSHGFELARKPRQKRRGRMRRCEDDLNAVKVGISGRFRKCTPGSRSAP